MKVLLISHPRKYVQKPDFPPIGIAYLGAVANDSGFETLLIDSGLMRISEIVRKARRFCPEVIGVTCWTVDRSMVWALCSALKDAVPNAFLVIGGPHATIYPEHILRKTHASAIVIGEGEITFAELLRTLSQRGDLKKIRGLALRGENNTPFFTERREVIENLDTISRPFYRAFKNFHFSAYGGFPLLPHPTAPIISSRGCVFDCTYCGSVRYWGKRWRNRSAENILEEIEWLITAMRAKSIFFFDDNFPVNKKRVFDICEGILERKLNISWSCCSHVKMVEKDLLGIMKKSGCVSIDFGVESGSDKILKNINKKQTARDIERAFALVHAAGIKPRAYLMVGNKGEDEATIDETVGMISRIKPYSSIGASILWLLPGTAVYNEAVAKGFIDDGYWLTSDNVPCNLQEHSYDELAALRKRLMYGIARDKGSMSSMASFYLKQVFYKYPFLSPLRAVIPDKFR